VAASRSGAAARRALGATGEQLAAEWYEGSGYEVLDRNWRCRQGEIDLVCRRGATVVVCEVKTRASVAFGAPVEAVTGTKQRRIRRLAAQWLRDHSVGCNEVRFDVAAVRDGRVRVVEDAF
jgi:putative endonuclease